MEITIAPELQELAEQKVASGEYASFSELVSAALRPLLQPPLIDEDTGLPFAELKHMIAESEASFERGEGIRISREGLKDFFEAIKIEGRQRLEAERAASK